MNVLARNPSRKWRQRLDMSISPSPTQHGIVPGLVLAGAAGTDIKGDERAGVGDLFATVYHALGIDPALKIRDPQGRPLAIAEGKPIAALA